VIKIIFLVLVQLILCQTELKVYRYSDSNKVSNFERDFIESCVQLYNKRYKESLSIKFIEVNKFSKGFDMLRAHNSVTPAIYINTISYTKERDLEFDYSPAYLLSSFAILNKKSNVPSKTFLKDKKYGVEKGTLEVELLNKVDKNIGIEIVLFNSLNEMVKALDENKIDYFASDYLVSQVFDLRVNFLINERIKDKLCILYPQNKFDKFRSNFNNIISYYAQSPDYYNKLRQYFGEDGVSFFKRMALTK
jgi:ABC-type amino acid transport substrate-binding protein